MPTRRDIRPSRALVALALVVGLVVATGATSGAQPTRVTTGSSKPVVRIGVLAPLDAGLVEYGTGIRNSVQLAVRQANRRNAIPGWRIKAVAVDDSSDPAVGEANVGKLVDDPSVIGVVGTYNSGVAERVLPTLAAAGLALVSPGNTLASLTQGADPANPQRPYDTYFRMVASDALQGPFLARRTYARGIRRVAVVSETKAVSKGLADAYAAAFEAAGGTVTMREVVPDGTTDFSTVVAEVSADAPDAVFFGGEYVVAATLRDALTVGGFAKPLVGGDGIKDQAYIDRAGPASEGDLASSVGTPIARLSSAKRYLAAYRRADFAEPPSDFGPYAYDAANLLVAGARKALAGKRRIPSDARATVVASLQRAKTRGASGPVGFDELGDTIHTVFTLFEVQATDAGLAWKVT